MDLKADEGLKARCSIPVRSVASLLMGRLTITFPDDAVNPEKARSVAAHSRGARHRVDRRVGG